MTKLFKKLNFKGQKQVHVVNAPEEFTAEMQAMKPFTQIETTLAGHADFILIFAKTQVEVREGAEIVTKHIKEDRVVWFAYPKGTSKKYKSEITRDHGWESLEAIGYTTVRSIAIDADWTGLRFRKPAYIKKMAIK